MHFRLLEQERLPNLAPGGIEHHREDLADAVTHVNEVPVDVSVANVHLEWVCRRPEIPGS